MRLSYGIWWTVLVAVAAAPALVGCDLPTEGPSFETETNVNTPVVAEKTFSFLGGPDSQFEPLVDTTTSTFDSLFTVASGSKDISIVQEIDNFDVGSLEGALDEAGGDFSIDESITQELVKDSRIRRQAVDASYLRTNEPYESGDPAPSTPRQIVDNDNDDQVAVPFLASQIFEAPDFGAVDASGATVEAVVLTSETTLPSGAVNQIEFTLTNNGSNTLRGDGGSGPPRVRIQDTDGTIRTLASADFGGEIPPGGSETATLDVSGTRLDGTTRYQIVVSGTDAANTADLTTDVSTWRYQATVLSDAQNVTIEASQNAISTAGTGASRFEGIEIEEGQATLAIDNQFSFPLEISRIQLQNARPPDFGSVPDLGVDLQPPDFSPIPSGVDTSQTIDNLGGKGITDAIDVNVTASPASNTITVAADDELQVSTTATLLIRTLLFRPDGEVLTSDGTVQLGQGQQQVTFEPGDFVELSNALINVSNLTIDATKVADPHPQAAFDTLTLSYPDIRTPPYDPGDSLSVRFVRSPSGQFEKEELEVGPQTDPRDISVSFGGENIRIFPQGNREVRFSVRGKLESDSTSQSILNLEDELSAVTSASKDDYTVAGLRVSEADPFRLDVTDDVDADGTLDLADNQEVRTASLGGFGGITDRVGGLELASTRLDFSVRTRNVARTDARLVAAIQGRGGTGDILLAGKPGTNREATSLPSETAFIDRGRRIQLDSLLQFRLNLDGARVGEDARVSKAIDDRNSNVAPFINALPSEVRFAGQVELNADGGDLRLQRPVELDAGFTVDVPLRIKGAFVLRDTLDADFENLENLTDTTESVSISEASFEFGYRNGLPLGADPQFDVVNENGTTVRSFAGDSLRIAPAPKTNDGAAGQPVEGTVVVNLGDSVQELENLSRGTAIVIRLAFSQDQGGPAARLRADDTIRLDFRTDVRTSVEVGD